MLSRIFRLTHQIRLKTTIAQQFINGQQKTKSPIASDLSPTPNRVWGVQEPPLPPYPEEQAKKPKWWVTDKEENARQRKQILNQLNTPYFKDISDLKKQGIKLWEASTTLIKVDKALYMPNIKGQTLASQKVNTTDILRGYTSMVAISFNAFGENQTRTFTTPFTKAFSHKPRIKLMELNLQKSYIASLVVKFFLPYMRRTIDQSRHQTYIMKFDDSESIRKALGLENTSRGYVFLVDLQQKIRWAAHGNATQREVETMIEQTKALVKRNAKETE